MRIVIIDKSNRDLVKDFIDTAGASLKSFRYFNTRGLQSLDHHLITCIMQDNEGKAKGYGHLDKEDDIVWLGIAIAEGQTGKGLGKILIRFLLAEAKKKNIARLNLSVDSGNISARRLYENVGFEKDDETNNVCYYKKYL